MAILASKRSLTLVIPSVLDADQPDMHTFLEFWPEQAKTSYEFHGKTDRTGAKVQKFKQKDQNAP